jgi:hypothetical protein
MTGLVRKATLLTACGLLLAGAAMASVPSAANSTVPCAIVVVGDDGVVASSAQTVSITVRDLANNPIQNSSVVIDFTGCNAAADPGPSTIQKGVNGEIVDCVSKTVRAVTNVSGVVNMDVQGLASGTAAGATPNGACAQIFADGVLLATVQVAGYDLDGASGVTAGDLSQFLIYSLNPACAGPSPNYCAIVDIDYAAGSCAAQDVSAADLSAYLTYALGTFVANGVICP